MSTPKQIEANRLNAQKSTGPTSAEGKAAVRFNALKSGIHAQSQVIPGEDPAALALLIAEYYDRYQPATPEVRALAALQKIESRAPQPGERSEPLSPGPRPLTPGPASEASPGLALFRQFRLRPSTRS
jgi:hypothetical protein